MFLRRRRIFHLLVAVLVEVLLIGDSIHSNDAPFASPHDNTVRLCRVGTEKALIHLAGQYPWLIFRGDVRTGSLGFGFGYNHYGEISTFFFDALGPSDTEHRHLLSTVVELPDLLDLSVVSFLDVTGEGFYRYSRVLIFAIPVIFLCVNV
jgi:hypothetical protein